MEFDQSLPSESVFYPHTEQQSSVAHLSASHSGGNSLRRSDDSLVFRNLNKSGQSSPPPPPPPLGIDEYSQHSLEYSDHKSSKSDSRFSASRPKLHTSFPSIDNEGRDMSIDSVYHEHDSEILLKGDDYWGFKDSLNQSKGRPSSSGSDSATKSKLDQSTVESTDWNFLKTRQKNELDEFEMLERQALTMVEQNSRLAAQSIDQKPRSSVERSYNAQPIDASQTIRSTSYKALDHTYDHGSHSSDDEKDFNAFVDYENEIQDQPSINDMFETVTSFMGSSYHHRSSHDDHPTDTYESMLYNKSSHSRDILHDPEPPSRRTSNGLSSSRRSDSAYPEMNLRPTSSAPKVVHSPPRSSVRESQRWGAVTQPVDDFSSDTNLKANSPERPINNEHRIGSDQKNLSRPSIQNHQSSPDKDELASRTSKASTSSRPSLSARVRARPNSAARPIIKPPKNITPDHPPPIKATEEPPDDVKSNLMLKAKELEEELEVYRKENATIKQLRKQQEAALEDIQRQKNEAATIFAEEKLKLDKFCEETKQSALKDRRTAAKILRDAKLATGGKGLPDGLTGGTVAGVPSSLRNAKHEIDALNATIEKLKTDYDSMSKKHRLNERRYQSLTKELQNNIEKLEQRISTLEEEKVAVWTFIDKSDLRVPQSLRANRPEIPQVGSKNKRPGSSLARTFSGQSSLAQTRGNQTRHGSTLYGSERRGNDSYAEELSDLEQYVSSKVSSKHYIADDRHNQSTKRDSQGIHFEPASDDDDEDEDEFVHQIDTLKVSSSVRQSLGKSSGRYAQDDIIADENLHSTYKSNLKTQDNVSEAARNSNEGAAILQSSQTNSSSLPTNHSSTIQISIRQSNSTQDKNSDPPQSESVQGQFKPSDVSLKSPPPSNPSNTASPRVEDILPDGTTLIKYRNGTTKQVFLDGRSVVKFVNGDSKVSDSSGLVVYHYAEARTTHTTYPDGLQVYEFPNGQVEKHFTSGRKEITFPDKTKKIVYADGMQESYFPDGVAVREYPDSRKEILSPEYIQRRGIP